MTLIGVNISIVCYIVANRCHYRVEMDSYLEQLGNKLRVERKKFKLNQADAGNRAGISRQDISEIENGQFKGSILKVQNYALSLGYSLSLEIKRRPELSELEELFNEN